MATITVRDGSGLVRDIYRMLKKYSDIPADIQTYTNITISAIHDYLDRKDHNKKKYWFEIYFHPKGKIGKYFPLRTEEILSQKDYASQFSEMIAEYIRKNPNWKLGH